MKNLLFALIISAPVFFCMKNTVAQEFTTESWIKNGSTLYYHVTSGEKKYDFITGDLKLNNDISFYWSMTEPMKSKGKVYMGSKALDEAVSIINYFSNGSDQKLETETTVWMSRKVYKSIKSQTPIDIYIDGTKETLRYSGNEKYKASINGKDVLLEVLKAETPTKNKFWILDYPQYPLIVKMELAFTIELFKVSTQQ